MNAGRDPIDVGEPTYVVAVRINIPFRVRFSSLIFYFESLSSLDFGGTNKEMK